MGGNESRKKEWEDKKDKTNQKRAEKDKISRQNNFTPKTFFHGQDFIFTGKTLFSRARYIFHKLSDLTVTFLTAKKIFHGRDTLFHGQDIGFTGKTVSRPREWSSCIGRDIFHGRDSPVTPFPCPFSRPRHTPSSVSCPKTTLTAETSSLLGRDIPETRPLLDFQHTNSIHTP